jgi:hypothetical protein
LAALQELEDQLSGGSRAIVISQKDVDLKAPDPNRLIVLKMAEGSLASGGRGGGFGERRAVKVSVFSYENGECNKLFETEDEAKVAQFEIPYYVSRIPIILRDGTESMGYGVVEPELVQQLMGKAGISADG